MSVTLAEKALMLAKVPPAVAAAVAAVDCAVASVATLAVAPAVAAISVLRPVKVALPSAKLRADLTVAVMMVFITAVTSAALPELRAVNWVALKEAMLLKAASEIVPAVPVAPKPVASVLAV